MNFLLGEATPIDVIIAQLVEKGFFLKVKLIVVEEFLMKSG